jgi:hypothetical protein
MYRLLPFLRVIWTGLVIFSALTQYTSNDMDQMELKEEEVGDDRGPFFLEDPPPPPARPLRWNAFHGDIN